MHSPAIEYKLESLEYCDGGPCAESRGALKRRSMAVSAEIWTFCMKCAEINFNRNTAAALPRCRVDPHNCSPTEYVTSEPQKKITPLTLDFPGLSAEPFSLSATAWNPTLASTPIPLTASCQAHRPRQITPTESFEAGTPVIPSCNQTIRNPATQPPAGRQGTQSLLIL